MKKMGVQALLCAMIFCLFAAAGNISAGGISRYSDIVRGYITKDYSVSDIRDGAVEAVSVAVDKPGELYETIVDGAADRVSRISGGRGDSPDFIAPVDEISVLVSGDNQNGDDIKYMSDESIIVHSAGRGMVESVERDETGGYTVTVKHDGGLASRYLGCTRVYAEKNRTVNQGQVIAEADGEGIRTLTFEIWKNGVKENPGEYIND
ncbi:MAG: M23 family metallopeptidase [Bacillota bacterium]|nr:M23 family metallopeptidase [Bacillota bacterium]